MMEPLDANLYHNVIATSSTSTDYSDPTEREEIVSLLLRIKSHLIAD